jgi:hypothetical protein
MNPEFHLDQDIKKQIKHYLDQHYGADVAKTAAQLGLHTAADGHHLLMAAQANRILITHNGKDSSRCRTRGCAGLRRGVSRQSQSMPAS